ncbi:hypothetical protein [Nocardia sp. NPDC060249]|uniref:hypothetical protein n=1 Tax=Nocardia sp. NPDC060249 TaxID=3347082 RepID=UPI00365C9945
MTDTFIRLTSGDEPFYVKASKIDAVGAHPEWKPGNPGARSLVIVGGDQIQCDEKPDSIIDTLNANVIEVDPA